VLGAPDIWVKTEKGAGPCNYRHKIVLVFIFLSGYSILWHMTQLGPILVKVEPLVNFFLEGGFIWCQLLESSGFGFIIIIGPNLISRFRYGDP
jgi:hypothetical protein